VNYRKPLIYAYSTLRGHTWLRHYHECLRLDAEGDYSLHVLPFLERMLVHCRRAVPYYAEALRHAPARADDPREWLSHLPVLTKSLIRANFAKLQSADIASRKCYFNTSGGSTGEPVRLIQDWEYEERSRAVTLMHSKWTGKAIGDLEIRVWGSERDVFAGTESRMARLRNRGTNTVILNAFRMTPAKMREYLAILNRRRPKLVLAYAQAIYELAQFAEQESIQVTPQNAIMTSAGTLYPFMRQKIESVFGARVFNRYGSREVGDMGSECPAHEHLHTAPMGHYLEIVDDDGNPVPDGIEGNILVTCLTNFAMPLLRYFIGDRGVFSRQSCCACGRSGRMLKAVLGRNVDAFRTRTGTLVDGEYFTHLLYFRDWVHKFQVVQSDYEDIVFKIAGPRSDVPGAVADEIVSKTRLVMGSACQVRFELMDDIPPSPSGKYRYTVSEVGK
jgi:phenylacetate-CoA ligase